MPLFKLVLDPDSYSNTSHNMFHFAFLVKDGHASVSAINGEIIAKVAEPPNEEDYNSGKATRKQTVVSFNYEMWEHLRHKYKLERGILPVHEIAPAASLSAPRMSQSTLAGGAVASKKRARPANSQSDDDSEDQPAARRQKRT